MEILLLIFALAATATAVALGVIAQQTRARLRESTQTAAGLQSRLDEQNAELHRLQGQTAADQQRIKGFEVMQQQFDLLAKKALQENQQDFLKLANAKIGEKMDPVKELLEKYQTQLQQIENNRKESEGSLRTHLDGLMAAQKDTREETTRLREALRGSARMRGRWGEHSLKNVAELAGMSEHCDFFSQQDTEAGRPDMVVHIPGGGTLAVDAKTPLENYINALESADAETRAGLMRQYAKNLRGHMQSLGDKQYWRGLDQSPEFVVMYVPGDHFLAAAFEEMPTLWEEAASRRVLFASPMIFLALMRTIAYGWKVRKQEENVARIANLGKQLYDRLGTMGDHILRVGTSLNGAVLHYNKFIGSLETRVLPTFRKFHEFGAVTGENQISHLKKIETMPRPLAAPELEAPKPPSEDQP